jgi:hypothetical protein
LPLSVLFDPRDVDAQLLGCGRATAQLVVEADKALAFGKPLAAAIMHSLARVLPSAPLLLARIETWPGDLAADGVVFRLCAGLHGLALSGRMPDLTLLYLAGHNRNVPAPEWLDAMVQTALTAHCDVIMESLSHPTQTNEVARVAGLVAALLELGREDGFASEVLELGASAGLNLNFPRYCTQVGSALVGAKASGVMLRPTWHGGDVASRPLTIARTAGVDLHPLDVGRAADCQQLKAYIWPGEHRRSARLDAAIALARRYPPAVEAGQASRWLGQALAKPQPAGVRRVVFHSMVIQYVAAAERAEIDAALAAAGARAGRERPLTRVAMEWSADRSRVELRITRWDGAAHDGVPVVAAVCHPYGEWFDWLGLPPTQ